MLLSRILAVLGRWGSLPTVLRVWAEAGSLGGVSGRFFYADTFVTFLVFGHHCELLQIHEWLQYLPENGDDDERIIIYWALRRGVFAP